MESNHPGNNYVRYRTRWFMLAVIMLFNISNGMIWITYASVVNDAAVYYQVSETRINWFSLVFFVFSVIAGLPSYWLIDTFGLRASILTGIWINAIGCIVRLLPSFMFPVDSRFWIALVGQVIAACSQPIILAIPTKLAALWFGDNERTIANTMASLSNPVGVLIASGLAPIIVQEPHEIKLLLIVFSLPSIIALFMATFGVCHSVPPTAPSSSAHEISASFFIGMKEALHSRTFIVLLFVFGFGVAAFSTVTSLLEQIICAKGYSNDIAGLCGALVIIGGLLFSGLAGVYVDKTKRFEETAKIMAMLAAVASSAVLICSSLHDQTVLLCISFFFFGATCLGVAPILLELGVECTYPVDEATSAGLQWLFGQGIGIFLMLGLPEMGRPLSKSEKKLSVCNIVGSQSMIHAKDFSNPLILVTGMLTLLVLIFVFQFKADYKRLHSEIEAKAAIRYMNDTQELDHAADDFVHT